MRTADCIDTGVVTPIPQASSQPSRGERGGLFEKLAWGRYLCHVRHANHMISVELFDKRDDRNWRAVIEITRYRLRINDDCLFHDLVERRTVPGLTREGVLQAAIADVRRFMNEQQLGPLFFEDGMLNGK